MRTRGAAALEMRSDSDVEIEEPVDMEGDEEDSAEEGFESEDVEGGANHSEEGEEEDEINSGEPEEAEEEEGHLAVPRLKIKLKLPTQASVTSGSVTPVKGYSSPSKSSRRYRPIVPESEEESGGRSSSNISENEQPSRATSIPSHSTRPMTTRQAVLASVVGSSHVSLDDSSRSKKQPLNESELALRREETARKRKNLTEKKLEDEKAETINRLLKRQSRPRGRRTIADVAPQENAEEGDGDEAMEGIQQVHEEVKPVMYRWISTSKPSANAKTGEKSMSISFSVPMIVDIPPMKIAGNFKAPSPAICAVNGCSGVVKYKLVRNSSIGACGMAHLKSIDR